MTDPPAVNPYSSPLADCSPTPMVDAESMRRQMHVVVRLYWWMGVAGIALYSFLAAVVAVESWNSGLPQGADQVFAAAVWAMFLVVFASSIYVAMRLAHRPQGVLPLARMVAIVLATAWFPILTIPAIICLRRTTKHFAIYCELRSDGADRTVESGMA